MNNFEEVCLLSHEKWVASFPEEIPKHRFSQKHKQKMKEIFSGGAGESKHRLSKTTIRILLIAAILLAVATTAFAIPTARKYITEKFLDHSEYEIVDKRGAKDVTSLTVNYIPEGFELSDEFYSERLFTFEYAKGDEFFAVDKYSLGAGITYDTEHNDSESIIINGLDAIYFKTDVEAKGIIFNDGKYIFVVTGTVSKEELIKIAQNIE
ncbi:MAG: DUF4367 domain-containing protein [Acutalibacteraceae bacterium]